MEWDQEKSLRLLDEYEKSPLLWDIKHAHYYTKNKKQEAWEAIASKFCIDMDELRKKMNSLLGSFRRERSRAKRSAERGKDYHSKWFAFEKLKFLLESRGDTEDIEGDPLGIETNEEEEILEVTLDDHAQSTRTNSNKRMKLDNSLNSTQTIVYHEKLPSTNSNLVDEFDAIGQNVAAKLRNMKLTQRIVAEKLIHDALYYGQLEKLCDSSCIQLIQMPLSNSLTLLSKNDLECSSGC